MHELAIVEEVIARACAASEGARVRRVVLEIGKLSAVLPDAVRFCFDLVAEGTVVEGAALEIIETPGRGRCHACGEEIDLPSPVATCACGGIEFTWTRGEELMIRKLEVA